MEGVREPARSRALIILNPVAGHSDPAAVRAVLQEALGAQGWHYDIYETQGHDDFAAQINNAAEQGCSLVVAAGGDGTVSMAANALIGTGIPLGILPVGTANVLALELGIPRGVAQAAALFAGEHQVRELDMMRTGNRNFILQIGIGLDSMMIKDTDRQAKRLFGRMAYLTTLAGKVFGYHSQRFTIVVDGKRMRPRAWQVLVANAGTLGVPPFRWGPGISPADHELDLCIFSVRRVIDYVRLFRQLITGKHIKGSNVTYRRIHRSVVISADRALPVQADGEIIGETPIQIDVVPRGIKIIVPVEAKPAPLITIAQEAAMSDDATAPHAPVTNPTQADHMLDAIINASEQAGDAIDAAPVEQTKNALQEALSAIKTPEQADQVLDELERSAGNTTERQVAAQVTTPVTAAEASRSIQRAAAEPDDVKPQAVIAQTAAQLAAADEQALETLGAGVQQALSPTTFSVPQPANDEERRLLQEALVRRLKPLAAADTALFLAINRMPHPPIINRLMYGLTTIMNRGDGWVLGLILLALFKRRRGKRALLDVLPALWLATTTVEFPIKRFFRRRRPFIAMVQAVVVGKKPGHYSFPSGHSAAAFGGAMLISRHFPRMAPVLYAIASVVGFSRVYLGAHYPGDVLSGATLGVGLSALYRYIIAQFSEELTEALEEAK